jgi:hypothetical protein
MSVRTDALSWQHHLHVAALSPAQQRKKEPARGFLQAARRGLSEEEL